MGQLDHLQQILEDKQHMNLKSRADLGQSPKSNMQPIGFQIDIGAIGELLQENNEKLLKAATKEAAPKEPAEPSLVIIREAR